MHVPAVLRFLRSVPEYLLLPRSQPCLKHFLKRIRFYLTVYNYCRCGDHLNSRLAILRCCDAIVVDSDAYRPAVDGYRFFRVAEK